MIYLQLFYTFFKIGLFGFGGGYAMPFHDSGRGRDSLRMGKFTGVY